MASHQCEPSEPPKGVGHFKLCQICLMFWISQDGKQWMKTKRIERNN